MIEAVHLSAGKMYVESYLFPVVQFMFDDGYMSILLSIGQGVKH